MPALQAIDRAHPEAAQIVVVGHGAALAIALASLLDNDPAAWTEYHFSNCSLTDLRLRPEPYIRFFNRAAHL